jgi:hypothetical protein
MRKRQGRVAVAGGAPPAAAGGPPAGPGSPIGVQLSPRGLLEAKRGPYYRHIAGNQHRAASAVLFGAIGLRAAAREFGVPVTSVHDSVQAARANSWTAGDLQTVAAGRRTAQRAARRTSKRAGWGATGSE